MTRPAPVGVSVVIPVYNSSALLPRLVEELKSVLSGCSGTHELILVNDSSSDRSWEVIGELSRQYTWVRGVDLMLNVGQHNALLCGIRAANFDVIITMDDDLQNPPAEVPKLLEKISQGFDVIYGVPENQQHGLWRNLASRITKLVLQRTMGAEIAQNISAFRAFRTRLRESFQHYSGPFVSIDVLLTWGTTSFAAVRVRHEQRHTGSSGYGFRSLIAHALNMMTGFSVVPLQIASLVGFAFTLFGIVTLVFVVESYLIRGSPVPGFPFLASIVAIFSGAQLFALGIIGEYLARMHFRLMGKPQYVVSAQTINLSTKADS
jgi:glycosyltransferase involved in cell wall biosynthesis